MFGIRCLKSPDKLRSLAAESCEKDRDRLLIVAGLVGLPIGEIRRSHGFGAVDDVANTSNPQLLKIEQMADVLLDRPSIPVAVR